MSPLFFIITLIGILLSTYIEIFRFQKAIASERVIYSVLAVASVVLLIMGALHAPIWTPLSPFIGHVTPWLMSVMGTR